MARTIAIRVSDRKVKALEKGLPVNLILKPSNVMGGIRKRCGHRPAKGAGVRRGWLLGNRLPQPGSLPARVILWALDHGGRIEPGQVRTAIGSGFASEPGLLSHLARGGLLRRAHYGRYVVTPRAKRARAALSPVGPYRRGSLRERLLEWVRRRRRTFGIADVSRLLRRSGSTVHGVLEQLLLDRFVRRDGPSAFRATGK